MVVRGEVVEQWLRLERLLARHAPESVGGLRPGVPPAEVAARETELGFAVPTELATLWTLRDGGARLALNVEFLSIAGALDVWRDWRSIRADPDFPIVDQDQFITTDEPDRVHPHYYNPGWIPVLQDGGGNGYAVDTAPGPAGRVGQIANYGSDDDWRAVLALDLAGLLDDACSRLESGRVYREADVAGSPWLSVEIDGRRVDPLTGRP